VLYLARTPAPSFSIHPPGNVLVVWATAPEAAAIKNPPNRSQSERFDMTILRLSIEWSALRRLSHD
jgi:hypothetical protein